MSLVRCNSLCQRKNNSRSWPKLFYFELEQKPRHLNGCFKNPPKWLLESSATNLSNVSSKWKIESMCWRSTVTAEEYCQSNSLVGFLAPFFVIIKIVWEKFCDQKKDWKADSGLKTVALAEDWVDWEQTKMELGQLRDCVEREHWSY